MYRVPLYLLLRCVLYRPPFGNVPSVCQSQNKKNDERTKHIVIRTCLDVILTMCVLFDHTRSSALQVFSCENSGSLTYALVSFEASAPDLLSPAFRACDRPPPLPPPLLRCGGQYGRVRLRTHIATQVVCGSCSGRSHEESA